MPCAGHLCSDETLYRKVPNQKNIHYKSIGGGKHRVTSAAFDDKKQQISVDRAKLRGNDPELSKKLSTDLVVCLQAGKVRDTSSPARSVDVKPDPNPPEAPYNDAHALIVVDPPFPSQTQFQKFTRVLARIANSHWAIPPSDSA